MVRMGSVQPDYLKLREYIDGIPGASAQDSFQRRLGLIFREHGIGIMRDSRQIMEYMENAEIDQKTRNVFRTILITKAVRWFILYAEKQLNREAVEKNCTAMLRDEWGLAEEAFVPVIRQIIIAIDNAVKERSEFVGKSVCNQLKDMRRRFAKANQIEYYEKDCQETRPCAGTCPYCEERTRYLVEEAKKIAAVRDVIYPQVNVEEIRKDRFSTKAYEEGLADGYIDHDEPISCGGV